MSINIPQVYQTAYSANVSKAFQKGSLLSETVRNDGRIIGNKAVFRKSDKLIAQSYDLGSPIIPGNTDYETIEATLKQKYCSDIVYDMSKPNFNFSESEIVAENIAKALGRAKDQEIIDNGLSPAATTDNVLGDAKTYISAKMLSEILEIFNDRAIPAEGRFFVHKAIHLTMLLNSVKYMSSDYELLKAIQEGKNNTFRTFKFINIESREEGGLRPDATVANSLRCYAYSKFCVGYAQNQELNTSIERRPDVLGWQHTATGQMGAVNIRNEGIIAINTANSIEGMTGADDALAVKVVNAEDFPTA